MKCGFAVDCICGFCKFNLEKDTMTIFTVGKSMFAIGSANKTAKYVVRAVGKKVVGVRGRRPLLDDRFKKATGVRKDVAEALKAGASA